MLDNNRAQSTEVEGISDSGKHAAMLNSLVCFGVFTLQIIATYTPSEQQKKKKNQIELPLR